MLHMLFLYLSPKAKYEIYFMKGCRVYAQFCVSKTKYFTSPRLVWRSTQGQILLSKTAEYLTLVSLPPTDRWDQLRKNRPAPWDQ